jgi:hypothetical protein
VTATVAGGWLDGVLDDLQRPGAAVVDAAGLR